MDRKLVFEYKGNEIFMHSEGKVDFNDIMNAMNTIINCLLDSGFDDDELVDIFDNMLDFEEPIGDC